METKKEQNDVSNNSNFKNILLLSIGFMLMIGAWRTTAAIEQTVLQSVQVDNPSFTGDGYISQAIINGVGSLTNIIAPTIIGTFGVHGTLVVGSTLYILFIASFLYPNVWLLYVFSACIGFGSANAWVAYGIYLTQCSTKDNVGKHMGTSWVFIASGQLLGNAFVFWKFQGMHHINYDTRFMVAAILTGVSIMATVTFIFLGKPKVQNNNDAETKTATQKCDEKTTNDNRKSICMSITQTFKLLANKHLLLLIPTAMYNGLEMAFITGIYPTSVAFSESFGSDSRKLVGIAGILVGVGSLSGGLLFGVFLGRLINLKRNAIVMFACLVHCTSFLLMYLNLSDASPLGPTLDTSWINPPSVIVVMVCAFLLGMGDACISTQMSAAIGVIWPEDPSSAFGLYRFFQAGFSACGFFIGTQTGLYNQLVVFLAVTLIGTLTYCVNERIIAKQDKVDRCTVQQITVIKRKLSDGLAALKREK